MTEANISGPWLVHTADSVDSTQKWVRQRVSSLTDRSVLLASSQTEGRGRPGRTWLSPPGGFYASFLLKPSPPVSFSPCVSLLAALLLSRIMLRRGLDARVKWPNDVLVRGRKLAGIVAETGNRPESWFILGVGVNLQVAPSVENRRAFPAGGWSDFGPSPSPVELLSLFTRELDERWPRREADPLAGIREELHERLWSMNEEVTVETSGERVSGVLTGIAGNGSLLVSTDSGERSFASGELLTVHDGSVKR